MLHATEEHKHRAACHFLLSFRTCGPQSESGPRRSPIWTWTYSQYIIEVLKILTGRLCFDCYRLSGSRHPLTNFMWVKPSHVMLLSQSNLCIPGDKHCDSEYRQMKEVRSEWQTERRNLTWGETETEMLFSKIRYFIVRCTIFEKLFYLLSLLFLNAALRNDKKILPKCFWNVLSLFDLTVSSW